MIIFYQFYIYGSAIYLFSFSRRIHFAIDEIVALIQKHRSSCVLFYCIYLLINLNFLTFVYLFNFH